MKTCVSCGATLRDQAKFCTRCGEKVIPPKQESEIKKTSPIFQAEDEEMIFEQSKGFSKWMVIGLLLTFIAGGYYYYQYQTPAYDAIAMLEEASGVYHDPSGGFTGGADKTIQVEISGGHLLGSTEDEVYTFDLLIAGYHEYIGDVRSKGIYTDVEARYDPSSGKLIFNRKGSPLEWYIKKR